jgi:hypothetical protein
MTPAAYRAALETLGLSQLAAVDFFARSQPDPNSGCWLWDGDCTDSGYGRLTVARKEWRAHRASWAVANASNPGLGFVMHKCDTPACVNPDHLKLGDHKANMRDMEAKGRKASTAGDAHGKAVLTEEVVRHIRGTAESHASIARRYGLSPQAVSNARNGKTWKCV